MGDIIVNGKPFLLLYFLNLKNNIIIFLKFVSLAGAATF